MLAKFLRLPRGGPEVEVGVAIPVGCLMPIAAAVLLLVGAGVVVGTQLVHSVNSAPQNVVVRVIDDGAAGGPQVVSTQVVALR
jgi:hypothetical protein